jgi:hypothetical protein
LWRRGFVVVAADADTEAIATPTRQITAVRVRIMVEIPDP